MKKITPGLSSLGDVPENATDYMRPLLDYAAAHIPEKKHRETSLFIMATAGLRLIPDGQGAAILDNLNKELPQLYKFIVLKQHIEMISGKSEGIYSWLAVNYALGRFNHQTFKPEKKQPELVPVSESDGNRTIWRASTVGMLDMGGGSVQIAFEMAKDTKVPRLQEHLTTTVNLGCRDHELEHQYRLYVSTFLGYGANQAMTR